MDEVEKRLFDTIELFYGIEFERDDLTKCLGSDDFTHSIHNWEEAIKQYLGRCEVVCNKCDEIMKRSGLSDDKRFRKAIEHVKKGNNTILKKAQIELVH
jgi:hypothetical protein